MGPKPFFIFVFGVTGLSIPDSKGVLDTSEVKWFGESTDLTKEYRASPNWYDAVDLLVIAAHPTVKPWKEAIWRGDGHASVLKPKKRRCFLFRGARLATRI